MGISRRVSSQNLLASTLGLEFGIFFIMIVTHEATGPLFSKFFEKNTDNLEKRNFFMEK